MNEIFFCLWRYFPTWKAKITLKSVENEINVCMPSPVLKNLTHNIFSSILKIRKFRHSLVKRISKGQLAKSTEMVLEKLVTCFSPNLHKSFCHNMQPSYILTTYIGKLLSNLWILHEIMLERRDLRLSGVDQIRKGC